MVRGCRGTLGVLVHLLYWKRLPLEAFDAVGRVVRWYVCCLPLETLVLWNAWRVGTFAVGDVWWRRTLAVAGRVDNNPRLLLSIVVYSCTFGTFTYLFLFWLFWIFGSDPSDLQVLSIRVRRGLRGQQAVYCMHDERGVGQSRLRIVKPLRFMVTAVSPKTQALWSEGGCS